MATGNKYIIRERFLTPYQGQQNMFNAWVKQRSMKPEFKRLDAIIGLKLFQGAHPHFQP